MRHDGWRVCDDEKHFTVLSGISPQRPADDFFSAFTDRMAYLICGPICRGHLCELAFVVRMVPGKGCLHKKTARLRIVS